MSTDNKTPEQSRSPENENNSRSAGYWLDKAHDHVSPYLFVGLTVLFMLDLGDWTAYILVPGGLILAAMEMTWFGRFLWKGGWMQYAYDMAHYWLTAAWIKALLGISKLRGVWVGKVALTYAFVNFVYFTGRWAYQNVQLLEFLKATVKLVWNLMESLMSPGMLMHDLRAWLSSIFIGRALDAGRRYVEHVTNEVDKGAGSILVLVVLVTLSLGAIALVMFAIGNIPYRKWATEARTYARDSLTALTTALPSAPDRVAVRVRVPSARKGDSN